MAYFIPSPHPLILLHRSSSPHPHPPSYPTAFRRLSLSPFLTSDADGWMRVEVGLRLEGWRGFFCWATPSSVRFITNGEIFSVVLEEYSEGIFALTVDETNRRFASRHAAVGEKVGSTQWKFAYWEKLCSGGEAIR